MGCGDGETITGEAVTMSTCQYKYPSGDVCGSPMVDDGHGRLQCGMWPLLRGREFVSRELDEMDKMLDGIPDDGEPLTSRPGEYLAQPRTLPQDDPRLGPDLLAAMRKAAVEFTPSRLPRAEGTMTHLSLKYVEERLHALAARLEDNTLGTTRNDSISIATELHRHAEFLSGFTTPAVVPAPPILDAAPAKAKTPQKAKTPKP